MTGSFYYDIVCPYAYMAFSFLKRFDTFKKKSIALKPILLGGLFKHLERDTDPNASLSLEKKNYIRSDILRQAEFFKVPLKFHPRHPISTLNAMRLIHACDPSRREEITDRLYCAYWQENLNIDDEELIKRIAQDFHINNFLSEEVKENLADATKEAFLNKVFGVPTVLTNGRLYFGADRLLFLANVWQIPWPSSEWQRSHHEMDFYFDFSSPYSYLAWAEVKKAINAGVKINFKPILLGALFKEIGVLNIPMINAHQNKAEYFLLDMKDWAHYRGVNFNFSPHFPIRTILALRVALIEPKAIDAMYAAAWSEGVDIGDRDQLLAVLNRAGFLGEDILTRTERDQIKEQLKKNTDEAKVRGVFGVPTFFVKQEKFFGQDRFGLIKKALQM